MTILNLILIPFSISSQTHSKEECKPKVVDTSGSAIGSLIQGQGFDPQLGLPPLYPKNRPTRWEGITPPSYNKKRM